MVRAVALPGHRVVSLPARGSHGGDRGSTLDMRLILGFNIAQGWHLEPAAINTMTGTEISLWGGCVRRPGPWLASEKAYNTVKLGGSQKCEQH